MGRGIFEVAVGRLFPPQTDSVAIVMFTVAMALLSTCGKVDGGLGNRLDGMAVGAVSSEPVSDELSLLTGKITGMDALVSY